MLICQVQLTIKHDLELFPCFFKFLATCMFFYLLTVSKEHYQINKLQVYSTSLIVSLIVGCGGICSSVV